mmetsp:Transcript_17776/g.49249  ORF Transcript_17776/g.49249 Transcript_17776/m.49249 type:complete len:379 (-) Transcript_17776:467-1603(-)
MDFGVFGIVAGSIVAVAVAVAPDARRTNGKDLPPKGPDFPLQQRELLLETDHLLGNALEDLPPLPEGFLLLFGPPLLGAPVQHPWIGHQYRPAIGNGSSKGRNALESPGGEPPTEKAPESGGRRGGGCCCSGCRTGHDARSDPASGTCTTGEDSIVERDKGKRCDSQPEPEFLSRSEFFPERAGIDRHILPASQECTHESTAVGVKRWFVPRRCALEIGIEIDIEIAAVASPGVGIRSNGSCGTHRKNQVRILFCLVFCLVHWNNDRSGEYLLDGGRYIGGQRFVGSLCFGVSLVVMIVIVIVLFLFVFLFLLCVAILNVVYRLDDNGKGTLLHFLVFLSSLVAIEWLHPRSNLWRRRCCCRCRHTSMPMEKRTTGQQ